MFIAAANRAGEEPSYSFCGDSMTPGFSQQKSHPKGRPVMHLMYDV